MSHLSGTWVEARTDLAPPVLRDRVRAHAGGVASPDALAEAARRALAAVLAHPGDRSVALDLLSADGLVTLALLAQAELDPGQLEAFAASTMLGTLGVAPASD